MKVSTQKDTLTTLSTSSHFALVIPTNLGRSTVTSKKNIAAGVLENKTETCNRLTDTAQLDLFNTELIANGTNTPTLNYVDINSNFDNEDLVLFRTRHVAKFDGQTSFSELLQVVALTSGTLTPSQPTEDLTLPQEGYASVESNTRMQQPNALKNPLTSLASARLTLVNSPSSPDNLGFIDNIMASIHSKGLKSISMGSISFFISGMLLMIFMMHLL